MNLRTIAILCGAGLAGCAGNTARRASEGTGGAGPFAPAVVRIYPLTHVEPDGKGGETLVCHVEFRDRWFDLCKAVGSLEIQLYTPLGEGESVQTAKYPIDLADLERNALWFDRVTSTYRLQLGLPEDPTRQALRLRAVFTPLGSSEGDGVLRDEFVVER